MSNIFGIVFKSDTTALKKTEDALYGVAQGSDKVDRSLGNTEKTTKKVAVEFGKATLSVDEFAEALDIDASEFSASQKTVLTSLNNSITGLEKAGLSVDRFKEDQKQAGNSISSTGKVLNSQGVEVVKLTRRWQDLQKRLSTSRASFVTAKKGADNLRASIATTGGGMRLAGNSAQMLGYQLQDVAVQAQMGTSWFTIFGQQGSQLASVLGSKGALLGSVIAIGSAVGGVLYKAFNNVSISSEDLKERIDAVTDSFLELDEAQRRFIATEKGEGIKTLRLEAQAAESDLGKLVAEYNQLTRARDKSYKSIENGVILSKKESRENIARNKKIEELFNNIDKLKAKIETIRQEIVKTESDVTDVVSNNNISDYYKNILDSITIFSKAEKAKALAIIEGNAARSQELALLKRIEESSNNVLTNEMSAKDAAIAKGKAQQIAVDNAEKSAFESQLDSLRDFGKTKQELEKEQREHSLKMLETYAEEQGWRQEKINETKLLIEAQYQQNLTQIEEEAAKDRVSISERVLSGISTLADAQSDIVSIQTARKKTELQNDLANQEKFTAAEIALKDKALRAIFEKEKEANKSRILINTAVAASEMLNNPAGFAAALLNGAAQYAVADSAQYSSSSSPQGGVTPPPSVANNTTNNNGGNIVNFTVNNSNGGTFSVEEFKEYFQNDGILFDASTAQGELLR